MSRKVILYIAQSLDGYIARPDGSLDWLPMDISEKLNQCYQKFYERVDTVLMGSKTYSQIITALSPNIWPYDGKKTIVWSSRNITSDNSDINVTDRNVSDIVKELLLEDGKHIWVVGGATIAHPLIENNLIDEYQIALIPVILGEGIPLFPEKNHSTKLLELQEILEDNGIIQTKYTVLNKI